MYSKWPYLRFGRSKQSLVSKKSGTTEDLLVLYSIHLAIFLCVSLVFRSRQPPTPSRMLPTFEALGPSPWSFDLYSAIGQFDHLHAHAECRRACSQLCALSFEPVSALPTFLPVLSSPHSAMSRRSHDLERGGMPQPPLPQLPTAPMGPDDLQKRSNNKKTS